MKRLHTITIALSVAAMFLSVDCRAQAKVSVTSNANREDFDPMSDTWEEDTCPLGTIAKDFYVVEPVGSLKGIEAHFGFVDGQLSDSCVLNPCPLSGSKKVQLIKCGGTNTEILESISSMGYMPAPTQYLLGLVIQYPELPIKYKGVFSIDGNNRLPRQQFPEFYGYIGVSYLPGQWPMRGADDYITYLLVENIGWDEAGNGISNPPKWYAVIRK